MVSETIHREIYLCTAFSCYSHGIGVLLSVLTKLEACLCAAFALVGGGVYDPVAKFHWILPPSVSCPFQELKHGAGSATANYHTPRDGVAHLGKYRTMNTFFHYFAFGSNLACSCAQSLWPLWQRKSKKLIGYYHGYSNLELSFYLSQVIIGLVGALIGQCLVKRICPIDQLKRPRNLFINQFLISVSCKDNQLMIIMVAKMVPHHWCLGQIRKRWLLYSPIHAPAIMFPQQNQVVTRINLEDLLLE